MQGKGHAGAAPENDTEAASLGAVVAVLPLTGATAASAPIIMAAETSQVLRTSPELHAVGQGTLQGPGAENAKGPPPGEATQARLKIAAAAAVAAAAAAAGAAAVLPRGPNLTRGSTANGSAEALDWMGQPRKSNQRWLAALLLQRS